MIRDRVRPKVIFCLTRWPAKAISRLITGRGRLPASITPVSLMSLLAGSYGNCMDFARRGTQDRCQADEDK